jgi:GDP-L-fucose synthase
VRSWNETVNLGTGEEVIIRRLAELVKGVVGYEGEILYDPFKPDGAPRKLLDLGMPELIRKRGL